MRSLSGSGRGHRIISLDGSPQKYLRRDGFEP